MFTLPGNSSDATTGTESTASESTVDIHEPADVLAILLRILHDPPQAPEELETPLDAYTKRYNEATIIPLPLLELVMLNLVDKYMLDDSIVNALKMHLLAHAPSNGLRVYIFAVSNDMPELASKASQYVLPMARYTFQEVKGLPSVKAYHDLVRLQDFRVQALRDLLLKEDIFPHGTFGGIQSSRPSNALIFDV